MRTSMSAMGSVMLIRVCLMSSTDIRFRENLVLSLETPRRVAVVPRPPPAWPWEPNIVQQQARQVPDLSFLPRAARRAGQPGDYQLALRRPGTSPFMVALRSMFRPRPNLRYTPRERPDSSQRLRWRLGDESRGSFCSLVTASSFSS